MMTKEEILECKKIRIHYPNNISKYIESIRGAEYMGIVVDEGTVLLEPINDIAKHFTKKNNWNKKHMNSIIEEQIEKYLLEVTPSVTRTIREI